MTPPVDVPAIHVEHAARRQSGASLQRLQDAGRDEAPDPTAVQRQDRFETFDRAT
jgi:hypothetical protein